MNAEGDRPRTLVKICGIREPEHAIAAVEAGADMIGLVFYPPSHRHVTHDEARAVVAAIRETDTAGTVRTVGLFVNVDPAEMESTADAVGLDVLQLSGDEPPEAITTLSRPVLYSLRIDSSGRIDEQRLQARLRDAGPNLLAVHVDAHVPGMYGGTGTLADWFVAADFARQMPVLLAGGLTVENVGRAIRSVRPLGVDLSSGVETNRRKDPDKIRAFLWAVRDADAATPSDTDDLSMLTSATLTDGKAHLAHE